MPNTHVPANGSRLPATQHDSARLRVRMEKAVERLLTALDALDAAAEDKEEDDPGEDDGDDEPSLGWTGGYQHGGPVLLGGNDEREEDDPGEDAGDAEPSLGSFDRMLNQEKSYRQIGWSCNEDAEEDNADDENTHDQENDQSDFEAENGQ